MAFFSDKGESNRFFSGFGTQDTNRKFFGETNFGGRDFGFGLPWENMEDAMEAQNEWINRATEERRKGFDQAIGDVNTRLGDYARFGQTASTQLDQLLKDPSSIRSLPGYRFMMEEAEKGAENAMAPYRLSGRALKELEQFRLGTADQSYGTQLGRLAELSRTGYGMDENTTRLLAQLKLGRAGSEAQRYGDYSQYAFWHEQQGMDEAKQWMGSFRGSLFGGGMGGGGNQPQGNQQRPANSGGYNTGQGLTGRQRYGDDDYNAYNYAGY